MQDPLCSAEAEACVQSVNVSTNNTSCLKPCTGLMVTSFSHSEFDEKLDNLLYEEVIAYKKYKKWFRYPDDLKGFTFIMKTKYTGCPKKNVVSWKNSHNYPQTHQKCKCWGCIGKFRIFATTLALIFSKLKKK